MKKLLIALLSTLGISSNPTMAEEPKSTSLDLREMVFSLKSSDIGINKENFPFPVWGIVMETGFPDDGYFTLVVLAEGTVSFYLSNGGGIIGGGQHESVRKPAGSFLIGSKDFYKEAKLSKSHLPPNKNEVVFYFLTDEGIFSYNAPEEKLGTGNDKFSQLFHSGHEVIAELRKTQGG